MSQTTRRIRDGERVRGPGNPLRRWLALGLLSFSLAAALWVFNRDIGWEARLREARALGLTALDNNQYEEARRYFEAAVANNPYDWENHLSLANLLYYHLNDNAAALRHYLYATAYSPEPVVDAQINDKIAILRMMRSGQLENPIDAIEDMSLAAEAGTQMIFMRRLAPRLRADVNVYLQAWARRGRGQVTYRSIDNLHNGFYDAVLEIDYPDGTTMSMRLLCPVRDIWRLELSFP